MTETDKKDQISQLQTIQENLAIRNTKEYSQLYRTQEEITSHNKREYSIITYLWNKMLFYILDTASSLKGFIDNFRPIYGENDIHKKLRKSGIGGNKTPKKIEINGVNFNFNKSYGKGALKSAVLLHKKIEEIYSRLNAIYYSNDGKKAEGYLVIISNILENMIYYDECNHFADLILRMNEERFMMLMDSLTHNKKFLIEGKILDDLKRFENTFYANHNAISILNTLTDDEDRKFICHVLFHQDSLKPGSQNELQKQLWREALNSDHIQKLCTFKNGDIKGGDILHYLIQRSPDELELSSFLQAVSWLKANGAHRLNITYNRNFIKLYKHKELFKILLLSDNVGLYRNILKHFITNDSTEEQIDLFEQIALEKHTNILSKLNSSTNLDEISALLIKKGEDELRLIDFVLGQSKASLRDVASLEIDILKNLEMFFNAHSASNAGNSVEELDRFFKTHGVVGNAGDSVEKLDDRLKRFEDEKELYIRLKNLGDKKEYFYTFDIDVLQNLDSKHLEKAGGILCKVKACNVLHDFILHRINNIELIDLSNDNHDKLEALVKEINNREELQRYFTNKDSEDVYTTFIQLLNENQQQWQSIFEGLIKAIQSEGYDQSKMAVPQKDKQHKKPIMPESDGSVTRTRRILRETLTNSSIKEQRDPEKIAEATLKLLDPDARKAFERLNLSDRYFYKFIQQNLDKELLSIVLGIGLGKEAFYLPKEKSRYVQEHMRTMNGKISEYILNFSKLSEDTMNNIDSIIEILSDKSPKFACFIINNLHDQELINFISLQYVSNEKGFHYLNRELVVIAIEVETNYRYFHGIMSQNALLFVKLMMKVASVNHMLSHIRYYFNRNTHSTIESQIQELFAILGDKDINISNINEAVFEACHDKPFFEILSKNLGNKEFLLAIQNEIQVKELGTKTSPQCSQVLFLLINLCNTSKNVKSLFDACKEKKNSAALIVALLEIAKDETSLNNLNVLCERMEKELFYNAKLLSSEDMILSAVRKCIVIESYKHRMAVKTRSTFSSLG
ncbi:hypothetical protein Cyrtocomes_00642 [Candidatus Cyrtobacter comes]|uniref:Uncharacterized protein n=1 Tax=Candidatus Cyrtobacter comes TaxID=675776 RepID=A0ABU5L8T7_9RICK|nr:hypothetical protein [Candidatus Cyrtobacter comes]MDZ5762264.1 hypothetical protein [Candidatus Cyrtobacter comes]